MNLRKRITPALLLCALFLGTLALAGCGLRPPEAPTDFHAFARENSVDLSWTASVGASNYDIGMSTTPGGPYTSKGSTTEESFKATGLTNGTTYYFVVKAENEKGWSGYSSEASATPQPKPNPPANLGAVAGNGCVSLNWDASAGANSYAIYKGTSASAVNQYAGSLSAPNTSYVVTGLQNGTTYYFAVQAGNSYGWSDNSIPVSATPSPTF